MSWEKPSCWHGFISGMFIYVCLPAVHVKADIMIWGWSATLLVSISQKFGLSEWMICASLLITGLNLNGFLMLTFSGFPTINDDQIPVIVLQQSCSGIGICLAWGKMAVSTGHFSFSATYKAALNYSVFVQDNCLTVDRVLDA